MQRTWLNRFTATSAVKSSNFLIDYQCPQCGAPAVLDETDRLFFCEYCRVKSYLITKDYFRYTLPSKAPENKKLLYFPYWRFKGMLFSCVSNGVRQKFIDVSHQAVNPNRKVKVRLGILISKKTFFNKNIAEYQRRGR